MAYIYLQAPGPEMVFAGMPSGATYLSNWAALIVITNGSTADQAALAAAGCQTLSPINTTAFPPQASAPSSPAVGACYFDTTLGFPRIYGADSQWHGFLLN